MRSGKEIELFESSAYRVKVGVMRCVEFFTERGFRVRFEYETLGNRWRKKRPCESIWGRRELREWSQKSQEGKRESGTG